MGDENTMVRFTKKHRCQPRYRSLFYTLLKEKTQRICVYQKKHVTLQAETKLERCASVVCRV